MQTEVGGQGGGRESCLSLKAFPRKLVLSQQSGWNCCRPTQWLVSRQDGWETDSTHPDLEYRAERRCGYRGTRTGKGTGQLLGRELLSWDCSVCLLQEAKDTAKCHLTLAVGSAR